MTRIINHEVKKILIVLLIAILTIGMVPLNVNAAKVPAVKNLHAKNTTKNNIKVTWKSVKGRTYYKITAKCDGKKYAEGTYKIKSTKYTFKNVPRDHKYSFTVQTVIKGKKSANRTVSIKMPRMLDTPELSGYSHGYRRNELIWTPVTGATGYTVIETDLTTNETTETIFCEGETTGTFYKKTADRTYAYKIQAFSDEEDGRIVSEWTDAINIVTKKTYIGQAASNRDGKKGDGDGREVLSSKWVYSNSSTSCYNWTYVFRFKNPASGDAAATMMEKAIANDNIGYDGNWSVVKVCRELAAEVNYDLSKITEKTGCACGGIVGLCIKSTGIDVDLSESGLGVAKRLKAMPDDFKCYTGTKYISKQYYLQRGDVLVTAHPNGKNNHVVMVL